jgi:hypothetical protein
MKTVIDAVNEFKGEGYDFSADWIERSNNKHCYIEVTAIAPNRREIRNIGQIVNAGTRFNRGYSRLVCTKDEFLEAVAECETNFGKCNQSYSDYKFDYHLSPEPALTYTQAMHDNGEFLPPVNMIVKHKGVKKIVIGELDFNNKLALKSVDNEFYSLGHIEDIEPLTPPIELIDGECYQGIHKGNGKLYKGVYVKSTDEIWHGKCSNPVRFYTNIQPLTVEVK